MASAAAAPIPSSTVSPHQCGAGQVACHVATSHPQRLAPPRAAPQNGRRTGPQWLPWAATRLAATLHGQACQETQVLTVSSPLLPPSPEGLQQVSWQRVHSRGTGMARMAFTASMAQAYRDAAAGAGSRVASSPADVEAEAAMKLLACVAASAGRSTPLTTKCSREPWAARSGTGAVAATSSVAVSSARVGSRQAIEAKEKGDRWPCKPSHRVASHRIASHRVASR